MDGQLTIWDGQPKLSVPGCGDCMCKQCLYFWSDRCPYGSCWDDERARRNPYDAAHPGEPPRTGWSNWRRDQAYWCRGGVFYPTLWGCPHYVRYDGSQVRECLRCNVQVYQDGYIVCSLVDTVGCEACYVEWLRASERRENA